MSGKRFNYQNLAGGALVTCGGIFMAVYAVTNYRLGTIDHMGPGMYPAAIGCLLTLLGLAIFLSAFGNSAALPKAYLRPAVAVLGGMAAFCLSVNRIGMVPAILLLTVVSSLAERQVRIVETFVLAVGLAAVAVLIFRVGLEIQFPIFKWPE